MCIPILEVEGYEADDVIGTLSQKGVEAGYEVFMVTPDKDYGQLVRDNCKIYKQKGADGSIEIVDRDSIREKYGIDDPVLVRDILALWGDASDNIPGVPGIGEKSACKLVQEWGTVENILDNVSKIKGKQGEKIAAWGDKLRLAKHLTTICLDVPIPFRPAPSRRSLNGPRWSVRATSSAIRSWRCLRRRTFPPPNCRPKPKRCSSRRRRPRPTTTGSWRTPRSCATWWTKSGNTKSSASTPRRRDSTSSTTASSACRWL